MANVFDNTYKITYMVGNGFDLGCGLKSRFKDTYELYSKANPDDNKNISDFKDNILRYVLSEGKGRTEQDINWSDFEMGMAKYAEKLSSESDFVECVRDYSLFLADHLRQEEKFFYDYYYKEMDEVRRIAWNNHIRDSVIYYYKGLNNNDIDVLQNDKFKHGSCEINIINFNYTSIFETFLKHIVSPNQIQQILVNSSNIVHIHGDLREGIVLGVDNANQFGNLKYELSEVGELCFIKPTLNDAFDKQRIAKANSLIQSSDLICVVGMSLGDSDLTWREAISSWLVDSEKHHLIYYDIELMRKKGLTAFDILMTEKRKKAEFLEKIPIMKDVSSQIHFPIGNLFFNIIHIPYELKATPETPLIIN